MATASKAGVRTAVRWLLVVTLLAPVLVLIAAFGTRFGLWSVQTGWGLLTWDVGLYLAGIGALAGVIAVVASLADMKRSLAFGLAALFIGSAVAFAFMRQTSSQLEATYEPDDVSSDVSDPPGFSASVQARLTAAGPGRMIVGPQHCTGLGTVRSQVAPGVAVWALEQAGFTPRGAAAFRADGSREGFWYGFNHEAVIRIRPGQTDVRVAAVEPGVDGGDACRLAVKLVNALETPSGQASR